MKTFEDFTSALLAHGVTKCPIEPEEYFELMHSGIGFDGAVSVTVDVAAGFDPGDAWVHYVNGLIKGH